MKTFIKIVVLLVLLGLVVLFRKDIINKVTERLLYKDSVHISEGNLYALPYSFTYLKETEDFYAKDKKQLLNIFYTALNRGFDSFYFFCEYDSCKTDVKNLLDGIELANVNNFVHPYNTYRNLYFSINSLNKVSINVEKVYSAESRQNVETKLNSIIDEITYSSMPTKDKIKAFHDYLVTNTLYDYEYVEKNKNDIYSPSHDARGTLFYNKALCGGYTDTMSIFLNKLNIPNYRVASKDHVWNALKLDNNWYHLDVTLDDPNTNDNLILDTFFLIDTNTLEELNTGYHLFDKTIYSEVN